MTTTTSRLLQTINDFRERLLQREAQAAATMDRYHQHTIAEYITPKLNALYKQIEEKQKEILASRDDPEDKSPPEIPQSWLYEAKRLETIEALISGKIDDFGAMAQAQTLQLQRFGVNLGLESAQSQLRDVVPSQVKAAFGVPSTKALTNLAGATQKGSPLADLFNGFGQEAAIKASQALVSGVTLGNNPRMIAKGVQDALGVSRQRALVISRTESMRAYRGAALETYRANDDVVGGWIWVAALNARTCAACIAMNGTKHPLSEEFGSHPCCRCTPVPQTKSWDEILGPLGIDTSDIPDTRVAIQSGPDWFNGQDEETKKAILGAAKYAAYHGGGFTLEDVVGRTHDKDWGSSIRVRSIEDAKKAAEARIKREAEMKAAREKAAKEEAEKKAAELKAKQEAEAKKVAEKPKSTKKAGKPSEPFEDELGKMTTAEKEKFIAEHGGTEWMKSLTTKEKNAITKYTTSDFKQMNATLRTGKKPTQAIKDCQAGLLKSRAPANMVVKRGYGEVPPELLERFIEAAKTGGSFQEKGFASTTIKDKADFHGFQVNIYVHKGAQGAYVSSMSAYADEREFLIPYGAEFKVIGGKKDKRGRWTFDIEYRGMEG